VDVFVGGGGGGGFFFISARKKGGGYTPVVTEYGEKRIPILLHLPPKRNKKARDAPRRGQEGKSTPDSSSVRIGKKRGILGRRGSGVFHHLEKKGKRGLFS